ncbi:hypothetical protein HELRODRAFT_188997 [Helobdella robusta]|uniref:HP domain-containing protein n=1 Tax=Helobdella robusta TaxID=6412 RepID=T1FQJ6_HELRO|nr:hypothetical protein HELRODRAFT_188997 [Helobdella robusta]ESN99100.1 hypothetical protein HELRODRAFT_188997 [Helobdella robusta]
MEESAVSKGAGDAKEGNNYPVGSVDAVSKENNGTKYEKILKKDTESKISPVNVADSATNQSLISSVVSPRLEEEYPTVDHPTSPSPYLSVDQSSISAMHHNTSGGYPYEQDTLRSGHSQFDSSINKSLHSSTFGIPNKQFYNMSYLERVGTNTILRREGNHMNQGLDALVRNLNAAASVTLNGRSLSTLPTYSATHLDGGLDRTHSKNNVRNKSERDLLVTSSQENSSDVNDSSKSQAFVKLEKKICELEKIASMESGAAAVILKELKKQRSVEVEVDPRDTSRDPSAEKSLPIVFKCQRPRLASPTGTLQRFAAMSDGRRCVSSMMNHPNFALPRCHSLRYKSVLSSPADNYKTNVDSLPMHSTPVVDVARKLYSASNENEAVDGVVRDPITGLKKRSSIKMRSFTLSPSCDSPLTNVTSSYMQQDEQQPHPRHKTRWQQHQHEYDYTLSELQDALNCNQLQLDRDCLEEYLSNMEFESLFKMPRNEFRALQADQQILLKKKYLLA